MGCYRGIKCVIFLLFFVSFLLIFLLLLLYNFYDYNDILLHYCIINTSIQLYFTYVYIFIYIYICLHQAPQTLSKLTVSQLEEFLSRQYGAVLQSLSVGDSLLYADFLPGMCIYVFEREREIVYLFAYIR